MNDRNEINKLIDELLSIMNMPHTSIQKFQEIISQHEEDSLFQLDLETSFEITVNEQIWSYKYIIGDVSEDNNNNTNEDKSEDIKVGSEKIDSDVHLTEVKLDWQILETHVVNVIHTYHIMFNSSTMY